MKRLLWVLPALMLGGCVAVPYDSYPYQGQAAYGGYGYYGYASPAPVYVAPSAGVYFGSGYRGYHHRGWGGRRWHR